MEHWNQERSEQLLARAQNVIPGGVNSPVRAFKSVGGTPPFIVEGKGAYVYDVDGHKYIDFVNSWGPLILGHAAPEVVAAVVEAVVHGSSFGAPTEREVILAEMIVERVPAVEMVRLVNSGTEATMSAVRVARGVTKREKFIKFDGCYHGHGDGFLIAAGSGATTLGIPNSPGVPASTAADTLLAKFNDIDSVAALFTAHPQQIAAVIVEPVPGNMGCIPPRDNFLQKLRDECGKHGALLIFDEVMTGFRVASGGANELYDVEPDLLCFGKVIGGGMPIGAYGGKAEYMQQVAPAGPIYQAGTLSGNPAAVAAGIATLAKLTPEVYCDLEEAGAYLESKMQRLISDKGYPLTQQRVGSMFSLFFGEHPVNNYDDVKRCDIARFNQFFHAMLQRGVYLAPSQYEAGFVSTCHTRNILDFVVAQATEALAEIFR